MQMSKLIFGIIIALFPLVVNASVSLKNGNFFIGYTDIVYPGGFEPKIDRVYNSKTPYRGMFGWGWGNEYDVYLTVAADGSVVIHEYGGGAENTFSPTQYKAADLDKAVDQIAAVASKVGAVGSGDQLTEYKKKLKTDGGFRNDEWEKFVAQGKLEPRNLPEGTQLVSKRFSFQYITRVKDGYLRTFETGRSEKFDLKGHLVRVDDKNKNYLVFSYDSNGKLQKVVDNFNRKIFFGFNNKGLVEKISGESGKEANYKYNDQDELVYSKDVDGNTYEFKYSSDKRHNMTEVGYSDKTKLAITYYGRDKNENVKSVKDRDGTLTEYSYEGDGVAGAKFKVAIKVKGSDGQEISSSEYEYFNKTKANGEDWNYRMVATIDGDTTDTTYNESGLPLVIKRGDETTAFAYDDKGKVTMKETPTEITNLKYDADTSKVARVERKSKLTKGAISWSEFKYDTKGNLTFAKNSDKRSVNLFYDQNGRIASMQDQNKRKIEFKYNENSKPISITDPALGTINVSYTNSGEIKKVESTTGRKIALQVTSAFQNLLDIIRPAGVSLSF